nr:integrase, catalytic region, zinc finger, CCHC-type, peptidase aspartic, catalytic [Tanacetum cinerariifolium]
MSSFNQQECLGCGQPCDGLYCYPCTCQQCGVGLTNEICLNCTYRDGKPLICSKCEGPRSNEDIQLEMAKLIKNNRILLNNNIFPYEEASMEVLLAKERILNLIQAWHEKQIKSWSLPELLPHLLNDSRTIDEMLKQREQATNLAVQKEQEEQAVQSFTPYWNFSMIDDEKHAKPEDTNELLQKLLEDLQIISEELAEYINSLGWNHPTFYNNDEEHSIQYKEYVENSSNAITTVLPTEEPEYSLSIGDDELLSKEDVPMENFKIYLNPLFDNEEINSNKIDPHYFNAESDLIESLSNRDTLFDSSPKFDYLEEFSEPGYDQWGNILISRVYFVEGLGHNLLSVGQFCDSNLEVAL